MSFDAHVLVNNADSTLSRNGYRQFTLMFEYFWRFDRICILTLVYAFTINELASPVGNVDWGSMNGS